jgi:hypothetical protein
MEKLRLTDELRQRTSRERLDVIRSATDWREEHVSLYGGR